MVPYVLCFGVDFFCAVWVLCTFSCFWLGSVGWEAACWEVAARSACGMFSEYRYLIVNLVFPTSVLRMGFFSDCSLF